MGLQGTGWGPPQNLTKPPRLPNKCPPTEDCSRQAGKPCLKARGLGPGVRKAGAAGKAVPSRSRCELPTQAGGNSPTTKVGSFSRATECRDRFRSPLPHAAAPPPSSFSAKSHGWGGLAASVPPQHLREVRPRVAYAVHQQRQRNRRHRAGRHSREKETHAPPPPEERRLQPAPPAPEKKFPRRAHRRTRYG